MNRPLAYSTLADLVHHIRAQLSFQQLSRVVHMYSRNIHDTSLAFCIRTMSAKLLLNLVESIVAKNADRDNEGKGRLLVMRIFDAFVNKFSSLKKQIPRLFKPKPPTSNQNNIPNIDRYDVNIMRFQSLNITTTERSLQKHKVPIASKIVES